MAWLEVFGALQGEPNRFILAGALGNAFRLRKFTMPAPHENCPWKPIDRTPEPVQR